MQAAARAYFDKDVDRADAARGGLSRGPAQGAEQLRPGPRHRRRRLARRNYVLREMAKNGYISEAERAAAETAPLGTIRYGSNAKFREQGGYFLEEVRRTLLASYGESADDGPNSIYAGGLSVRTSMVPEDAGRRCRSAARGACQLRRRARLARYWAQHSRPTATGRPRLRAAALGTGFPDWRKAVVLSKRRRARRDRLWRRHHRHAQRLGGVQPKRGAGGAAFGYLKPGMIIIVKQLGADSYALRSIPEIGGGFVAEEVHTGRVMAMQGGFDVIGSSYNRATQAKRQPGSAFKPIVYVTALENGLTPASILVDAPFCVWQGAGLGNKCFRNFDKSYSGPKTMRWGVEQSRNLMTIRAASQTGMDKVVATASKLGVGDYRTLSVDRARRRRHDRAEADQRLCDPRQPGARGEADADRLCPGPQRQGHLPQRQSLRGDGQAATPPTGTASAMPRPPVRARQLLDPQAAYQMVHIMEGVVERGTATVLRNLDRPMFGKTGTTSGPTNVWFVGGTPDIVAGVYLGYDQPRADGRLCAGRADRRAGLQAIRRDRVQGLAQDAVRRAAGHPHGAHRPRHRAPRLRHLPDHRGSQVVGHLGSVPARNRAAPHVPPQCASSPPSRLPRRASRSAARRGAAPRPRAAPAPADSGEFLQNQGGSTRSPTTLLLNRRPDPCAPKRKPISTRSRPRIAAAAPLPRLGPRAASGSTSSTPRSRTRRCGTTPRRRRK